MDTRKFIYRCPLLLMLVAFIAISIAVSCSHNREQFQTLQNIENLAHTNPDSALSILNEIDFSGSIRIPGAFVKTRRIEC